MSRSRLRGGLRPPMTMLMDTRTQAQEQLERYGLATCTNCLPPILSRAPTPMNVCPQQLLAGPDRSWDFENGSRRWNL